MKGKNTSVHLCVLQVSTEKSKCARKEPEGRRENGDVCASNCICADMMTYGKKENQCEWVIQLSFRSEGNLLGEERKGTKEQGHSHKITLQLKLKLAVKETVVN